MDITSANLLVIEAQVIEALRTVFDPEIPVNVYELGLIYEVKVDPSGAIDIRMTLTSPNCPAAGTLPGEVQEKAKAVPGVTDAKVEVVFDPPWDPSSMSEAAKLELGLL
jgi:FeS assembly SUF system protein